MRRDNLPRQLPDAALAYLDALPPGEIIGFPIAPLDRTGVPVWVVALFLDDGPQGAQPSGIGYGATDEQAILGALGEIAEAILPTLALQAARKTHGSYDELVRALGVRAVVDPLTLCLPAGSPVDRATALDWVEARRFGTSETVLVPIDIAACDYFELSPGYEPFTTLITNGLGAGPDIAWAVGHGVLELLQRDGNGLVFRALDQGVLLDLPPLDGRAGQLAAMFEAQGIQIYPKFATDEFGLANLYVVGHDRAEPRVPIMLSACGEACDPDRDRALVKAMTEFAAARVRKTFAHGPLSDARSVAPPGYVESFVASAKASLDFEEPRALTAMLDWSRDASALHGQLAETVYRVASHKPFDSLPSAAVSDSRSAGAVAIERLQAAGFDVLYVDCSAPGIACVKVIVPGLEVETMSYYRIGERNTAKLLARDHGLIRFGEPSETLRPVRLAPEAAARLGNPLFDTALADRIVGPLYPLYREPEAHHVAYRQGRIVTLRFAYNTNGAANHRLDDALSLIADSGYDGVALTLDHHHLDPFGGDWVRAAEQVAVRLGGLRLGSVVETGARYLLDPRDKHEPTLVSADPAGRARRVGFLERAIDIAAILGSETVSFWAGVAKPGVVRADAARWLGEGLQAICRHAELRGIDVSFEPEPGMLIETVADYAILAAKHPTLRLALDTGHCLVTQDIDPAAAVRGYAASLGTVAIEDMRRGDHTHLPFGQGDMDIAAVLAALTDIGWQRLVCVELSRESPRAHAAIPEAIAYLRALR